MAGFDDNDRTQIKSGGFNSNPQDADRTVLIPTPGARRNTAQPAAPASPPPAQSYQSAPQVPTGDIQTKSGLNPLVASASKLLALIAKLRGTSQHPNVPGLHSQMVQSIRQFEQEARDKGLAPEQLLAARYVLCSTLDEAVLNTPWGANSGWAQRSLLSVFHNETTGGEKVFQILARMQEAPDRNIDSLELLYLCLSFGFQGKYRLDSHGREKIEDIHQNLYNLIRRVRGDFSRDLSPRWKGAGGSQKRLVHFIPVWVVAAVVLAALLLSFTGFRFWLGTMTQPLTAELRNIESVDRTDASSVTPSNQP